MNETNFERVKSFIDGAKTGIDWLHHKGAGKPMSPTEYEEGFRHALDAISGHIDDIESESIEASL
jgi:hypothetical protein